MAKIERKPKEGKVAKKASKFTQVKNAFMTGISYMIPVIVGGGIIQSIAKAMGGYQVANNVGTIAYSINQIGVLMFALAIPVLTAYIANAICDRPGIAPGLAVGALATATGAGFLGGMIGGFLVGYLVNWIKSWKVPEWFKGLIPIMVIPVAVTFTIGCIFQFVLAGPIAYITQVIQNWLMSLQGGSKFAFGAILGAFWGTDYGGPITKIASSFATALNAQGEYYSTAAKMAAGMTPPLGLALSVIFARKKFGKADKDNAKAAIPLSCCYITEGALAFWIKDPVRCWCATIPGCAITGGLSEILGAASPAVHGGVFVIPMMTRPWAFVLSWFTGAIVTGIIYAVLKKPLTEEEIALEKEMEELSEGV